MSNTELNDISGQGILRDDYRKSEDMNLKSHRIVEFKRKQLLTDRTKAIGEELLAWLLTMAVITVFIHFISNLK